MKSQNLEGFQSINTQIREILAESSRLIMNKLIGYYEQAVLCEDASIRSLNDELASMDLSPNGQQEIDDFEKNLSLKQNTVKAKLEKRRVSKIQKLLHPEEQQPEGGSKIKPPKQKKK